jgi:hypothetical protein
MTPTRTLGYSRGTTEEKDVNASTRLADPRLSPTVNAAARVAETVLSQTRELLRFAELRLHAWRLARDPDVEAWIGNLHRAAADQTLSADRIGFDELHKLIDDHRS